MGEKIEGPHKYLVTDGQGFAVMSLRDLKWATQYDQDRKGPEHLTRIIASDDGIHTEPVKLVRTDASALGDLMFEVQDCAGQGDVFDWFTVIP